MTTGTYRYVVRLTVICIYLKLLDFVSGISPASSGPRNEIKPWE